MIVEDHAQEMPSTPDLVESLHGSPDQCGLGEVRRRIHGVTPQIQGGPQIGGTLLSGQSLQGHGRPLATFFIFCDVMQMGQFKQN
jgi:hypothetical protein